DGGGPFLPAPSRGKSRVGRTRQRRSAKASRKETRPPAVSARALMNGRSPSGAPGARRPQVSSDARRAPSGSSRMTDTGWEGAMLYRGDRTGAASRPKSSATSSPEAVSVNRPHIPSILPRVVASGLLPSLREQQVHHPPVALDPRGLALCLEVGVVDLLPGVLDRPFISICPGPEGKEVPPDPRGA